MGLITKIVFGALVGWIASIISGKNHKMGAFANIAVGLVGSFIGSALGPALGLGKVTGFNLGSFIVALLGAIVFLAIINLFAGKK